MNDSGSDSRTSLPESDDSERDPGELADEVDRALEALWRGSTIELDTLVSETRGGGEPGNAGTFRKLMDAAEEIGRIWSGSTVPPELPNFRDLEAIGRGGMGVVYRAKQLHPPRDVAIKLLAPRRRGELDRKRFHFEIEALATLDHPNIARVHEAGWIDDANEMPYMVMEFVRGRPVTVYAQEHQLSVDDRLSLFIRIAEAVHHAHQRGIMHRDLKPENILVTDDGEPKVLDFGIARRVDDQAEASESGAAGTTFLGTLLYSSPEAVTQGERAIDVRSDVYSLGVLLHELLIGRLPIEPAGRDARAVIRSISEGKIDLTRAALPGLDEDLRCVLRCAMAHDPDGRYASVAALADDLRRYRKREPIRARPPSVRYQFARFAQRNALLVSMTGSLTALLVAALALVSVLYFQTSAARDAEAEQRRVAEREGAKQQAALRFLNDMLSAANPRMGSGDPDVPVRAVVERAAASLDAIEAGSLYEPEVEATVRDTIGDVFVALAMFEEAERMYIAAQSVRAAHLPPNDPAHALSEHRLGALALRLGEMDQAQMLLESALETRRLHYGEDSGPYATTLNELSMVMTGRRDFETAHDMQQQVLAIRRRVLAENDPLIGQAINNIATTLVHLGQFEEAISTLEEALAFREQIYGESHPDIAETLSDLGFLYRMDGRHEESERAIRRTVDILTASYDEDHPLVASAIHNLAQLMYMLEDFDEALRLMHRALAIREYALGETHPGTILVSNDITVILSQLELWDEAEPMMQRVLEMRQQAHPEGHPDIAASHRAIGELQQRLERFEIAEDHLIRALDIYRAARGETHRDSLITVGLLADLYLAWDRPEQAEAVLLEAHEPFATTERVVPAGLIERLVTTYEALGRPEEAAHWRDRLPSS
ncbi:MAG: serine/threonine protein kinase [Phycisphaerales bacterium]|nr:MAG: serine/threonine protein kinase [Phycisphaerales bacterium]